MAGSDLGRVVLTHSYDDHADSAAEVASWGAAQVLAHAGDAPVIRGEVRPPNFTDFECRGNARSSASAGRSPVEITSVRLATPTPTLPRGRLIARLVRSCLCRSARICALAVFEDLRAP